MIDGKDNRVVISGTSRGIEAIKKVFNPNIRTMLLLGLFIFSLFLNGDIKPKMKRGFFCHDSSINYPYKVETIGLKTLLFITLALPGVVIKVCDGFLRKSLKRFVECKSSSPETIKRRRKDSGQLKELSENDELDESIEGADSDIDSIKRRLMLDDSDEDYEAFDSEETIDVGDNDNDNVTLFTRIPLDEEHDRRLLMREKLVHSVKTEFIKRNLSDFHIFFFGLTINLLLTGIGKITCGRLRPHFMQRCKPNVDCALFANANKYIEEYTCTNHELRSKDLSYITTSWPSGHASSMFFSMLYLILYLNTVIPTMVQLNKKVKMRYDPLLLYASYILMIGLACYISLTRISDYHHHPFDVFSGAVIGSITAITLNRCVFKKSYDKIARFFE